jgi:hypothetical protein
MDSLLKSLRLVRITRIKIAGVVQLVERLLAKEKVVGSNPIARSLLSMASWPSGKARVCKTLITGSNPVDASKNCEHPKELVHPSDRFLLITGSHVGIRHSRIKGICESHFSPEDPPVHYRGYQHGRVANAIRSFFRSCN